MLKVEGLNALVRAYNPKTNSQRISAAYKFGQEFHAGQVRYSGDPYFAHPVAVAEILAEQKLDDSTIITALLHDTIEDTTASYSEISQYFGEEVAILVDGVTKLTKLQLSSLETKEAENLRKLFIATSKDLRVILVKLADRLHNMRTIKALDPQKQIKKAHETMEIYAPLAGRMGMQWMREELEDLAFKVLNSNARQSIIRRFITLQKDAGDVIHRITMDMRRELEQAGIEAKVYGRAKKPYSVWRKMEEKKQGFTRLSDIYGFRVITEDEEDCYRALGAIHRRWCAVPDRFVDYISQPKSNGYRSLHSTVSGQDGKMVEVQIRTHAMHEVAETGVAAHWSYRDGVRVENPFAVNPVKWISSLNEQFEGQEDHHEFLEAVKLEMYSDRVFCFSPKGDVIELPQCATLIDFAFAIHSKLGSRTAGGKVDGVRMPLWTRLKNGQSVEIITAEGQKPQASWLEFATTGKARTAIRLALRDLDRNRFKKLGKELARAAFENIGRKSTDKVLDTAAKNLGLEDRDMLLKMLGSAEINTHSVVKAVYSDLVPSDVDEISPLRAVIGLEQDQSFKRATCCSPLPGERIVGITHRGKGVVVHAIDCDVLRQYENESRRWIDLHWQSGTHPPVYGATLLMTIGNDAGVLGRICTLIGEQKANISNLNFTDRKPDFYQMQIEVELRDVTHLHALMAVLEADSDVSSLERFRKTVKTRAFVESDA
ncbi:MAG: bifunctional (p)ppGpp synthetase/guanosine-3',5'-bis(diphosphate) 3'-pyrophosphohydrolase [Aestuariivita sp.]|nr:bifunctional (p)ppGpp synthetase/guanosine-3',5'-bis(diphosphate) 3'-pyrophosphohydrolase [Aestuariivita sp.]